MVMACPSRRARPVLGPGPWRCDAPGCLATWWRECAAWEEARVPRVPPFPDWAGRTLMRVGSAWTPLALVTAPTDEVGAAVVPPVVPLEGDAGPSGCEVGPVDG